MVLDQDVRITLSAGVAEPMPHWSGNIAERVLDAADKALYSAKRAGCNRARQFFESSPPAIYSKLISCPTHSGSISPVYDAAMKPAARAPVQWP
ncbi:MAG: hypothetical protein ACOCWR_04230 [Oceanidesulfovibrio sp.]